MVYVHGHLFGGLVAGIVGDGDAAAVAQRRNQGQGEDGVRGSAGPDRDGDKPRLGGHHPEQHRLHSFQRFFRLLSDATA